MEEALKLGENLFFERKFGWARVQKELEKRQFSPQVVDEVMKKLDPGYEERHIKYVILGKYGRRLFIDHEKEKITRSLVRFGYPEDKIQNVLESLERAEF
ncbi:MAG: RecX family transcriptional regulator [Oscillospiraceae bacterium]|jgi:SOS response regulatory protein OraA/RecX|nr:RecX family transcriptional regulator [Oscillospiraceae bacterium]